MFVSVTEAECAAALVLDPSAIAYDYEEACGDVAGFCRVRTLSGSGSCASGWAFGGGSATNVTGVNGESLTVCVVRQ